MLLFLNKGVNSSNIKPLISYFNCERFAEKDRILKENKNKAVVYR